MMDMATFHNQEYTREKYQEWFRKMLTTEQKLGKIDLFVAKEMVALIKGEALEQGVEWRTIQEWEQPIREEVNHVSNR